MNNQETKSNNQPSLKKIAHYLAQLTSSRRRSDEAPGMVLAQPEHVDTPHKRNFLIAGLLSATLLSTGMLAHYANQIYLAAEKSNRATKLVAKEDRAIVQFYVTLDNLDRAATRYISANGNGKLISELADAYQETRKKYAEFVTITKELVWLNPQIDKKGYGNGIAGAMQRLDAAMTALADDPRASAAVNAALIETNQRLGDIAVDIGRNHDVYINGLTDQLVEDWRSLRIFGAIAFAVWLIGAILMVMYVSRWRREVADILIEKQKIDNASKDALAAKNHFLGMISHELRTPLQAITASIDLLTERYQTDSDKRLLDRLNIAVRNLGQQLRDLTDYARLDSGKLELREEEVNPSVFLNYIIEEYRPAAEEKGLGLSVRIDQRDRDCVVVTDPYRFQQIANNLLSNAIKYTDEGQIVVWLHVQTTQPTSILLKVHDTGPGIPDDQIQNIFEPFTQIDKGSTRRHDGTGMGLAIVQKLVNLLKGQLKVRSTLGTGSRFEVTLPVEVRRVQSRSSAAVPPDEIDVRRILLVDDNMAIRQSLQDCVEACGYQCDVASGGNEAIVKAHESGYSAILLDINMKDIDGYEVAAALRRKIGPNQNAPIIAVTGNYNGTDEQKKPFTDFLGKPVRLQDMRQMLKKYVEGATKDTVTIEGVTKEPWNYVGRLG